LYDSFNCFYGIWGALDDCCYLGCQHSDVLALPSLVKTAKRIKEFTLRESEKKLCLENKN